MSILRKINYLIVCLFLKIFSCTLNATSFDIIELSGYMNGFVDSSYFSGIDGARIQSNAEIFPGSEVFFEQPEFLLGKFTNNLIIFENGSIAGGSVSWLVNNIGASPLTHVQFYAYLDADIIAGDEEDFAEGHAGDFFQIAKLGDSDQLTNLLLGTLPHDGGINGGGLLGPGDITLAIGFEIGTLAVGDSFLINLQFGVDGLHQFSSYGDFFLNGSVIKMSEPNSLLLIAIGSVGIILFRRISLRSIGIL
ncbi:MAG: hypothetical protein E6Q61_08640 [Nitrosomonas sp.]|nr:MAG: hypothetical protein E6Q61_08640 [Nitrosomonas sp.]